MSNLVVFDFDGTLVNINRLHKQAWRDVLHEVGLQGELATYLPYEPFLLERFDSAERVRKNFFASELDRLTLEYFFHTTDERAIVRLLLDLKESHLLYWLDTLTPLEMSTFYTRNIFQGIDALLADQYKLGIISSTRESVILKALRSCKLDDCFQFIIGEESINDGEEAVLHKYDTRVRDKIPPAILAASKVQPCYVGDDVRMDSLLARNFGFRFVQVPKEANLLLLKEWL